MTFLIFDFTKEDPQLVHSTSSPLPEKSQEERSQPVRLQVR